jgi:O-antigen/teichoic acid export membrane protein
LAAVPSVLGTRFVSQHLGAGEPERASRLFTAVLAATILLATVATAAFALARSPRGAPVLAVYVLAFSLYLLFKATYFAFGMSRAYARAEVVGFAAFVVVFGSACVLRSPSGATISTLVHPSIVVLLGFWDHRSHWRPRGAWSELARDGNGYAGFAVSTLANAFNGLASYHLLLVIASRRLDAESTGHLSVLLAALSPFSLLPTAFGSAAFPELSRRFGGGDHEGMTRLMRRSTIVLQGVIVVAMSPFFFLSGMLLPVLGLSPDVALQTTWSWILLALLLNCISAPAGHYLNASEHVHKHAILSVLTLALGTWVGLGAIARYGIVGAGIMRWAVDGTMAWARMALAEVVSPWMRGARSWLLAGHALFLAIFVTSVLLRQTGWGVALWAAASIGQVLLGSRVLAASRA